MIKKITLTPLSPYFFGGENIFEIDKGNKRYFTRSLEVPSQTTLFGALRFIGIKEKRADYWMSKDDEKQVGKRSYKLVDSSGEGFGLIDSISPLYLQDQMKRLYIRTPFDHMRFSKVDDGNDKEKKVFNKTYTPFADYVKYTTDNELRYLPSDYCAKDGTSNSWLCLDDFSIWGDSGTPKCVDNGRRIFEAVVQTISQKDRTGGDEERFAKKEYKAMRMGFSFVFFASINDSFEAHQKIVYLGQGKSAFAVEIDDNACEPEIIICGFNREFIYAQSDIYYPNDIKSLYAGCKFACVQTRDFRVFTTNYGKLIQEKRFNKSNRLKLIKAGSVFWPNNLSTFEISDSHAEIVGLNKILIGGKNV